jgi:hypothetical protein
MQAVGTSGTVTANRDKIVTDYSSAAEINTERIEKILTRCIDWPGCSSRDIARALVEEFPELRPQQQTEGDHGRVQPKEGT